MSTGSGGGWSNTITPGVTRQIDPLTQLRTTGSYTMQRFDDEEQAESDVFRFDTTLERVLAPRPPSPSPSAEGPMFVEQGDDTYVTPAVTASYRQALAFGSVSAFYDRNISTAGGLGGTTINQTFGASLDVSTLRRGLALTFAPQYTMVQTHTDDRIDVRSLILPFTATYRFNEWVAAVASYQFFLQRSDSTLRTESGSTLAADADQNRIFVGLQFGSPFRFDSPFR